MRNSLRIVLFLGIVCLSFSFQKNLLAQENPIEEIITRPEPEKVTPKKKSVFEEIQDKMVEIKFGEAPQVNDKMTEYAPDLKHYTATPVADEEFALLVESIPTDAELDLPGSIEINKGTPWKDSDKDPFYIDADINEMIIRFQYVKDKRPENKPQSFYLTVSFNEDRPLGDQMGVLSSVDTKAEMFNPHSSVVIRHSLPKSEAETGGVRIATDLKSQKRVLVRGRDDTSVVVIIPKVVEKNTRSLLLCPRDYDPWKLRGGFAGLHNTNYEMVGVEPNVTGKAEVGVKSGYGSGLASIHFLTTDDIQPARFSYDKSVLQYPEVSLNYTPLGDKVFQHEKRGDITSGILIQTVQHNSFNQKTLSTGEAKMTLKVVNIPEKLAVKYDLLKSKKKDRNDTGMSFKMATGYCVALMKKRSLKRQFLKEKLPAEAVGHDKSALK